MGKGRTPEILDALNSKMLLILRANAILRIGEYIHPGRATLVTKYHFLGGRMVDLGELPKKDLAYLLNLQRRAMENEDYFLLQREVCGAGAYPLKGSRRVTREVHESTLFRVAEDIVDRVGMEQGVIAPSADDRVEITDEIMGTAEAAKRLGITRDAVVKAAQAGRLKGKKIGNTWALLRRSVEGYEVAQHRVEAGRAAHRG